MNLLYESPSWKKKNTKKTRGTFKNLIFVPVKVQSLLGGGGLFGWTNSHNPKDFISEKIPLWIISALH